MLSSMPKKSQVAVMLMASLLPCIVLAKGLYLTNEQFLDKAFDQQEYVLKKHWLTKNDKAVVKNILYRDLGLRIRYWKADNKTAWVFNEIGKTEPITIGIVIEENKIQQLHILEFRESRGWEVKYDFFRDQFMGLGLLNENDLGLSRSIDGITGATLSVNAVKKISVLALYFNQQVIAVRDE